MARPPIDVLLPVRNARRTLPWAVADVLDQRDVGVRILAVVDTGPDGRDDGSAAWLAECAAREPRLVVLAGAGTGPADALQLALDASDADLVSHMEADDRCPPERLKLLHDALTPGLAGITSRAGQFGARTPGMRRYLDWQNRLVSGASMAAGRFIEIPALHQTGLYRRDALQAAGGYRCSADWPLDIDFWLRWFERDLPVAKVPRVLYRWRQHPRQSTRQGLHHDLASLRAAKVASLERLFGRRGRHPRPIHLVSTGRTLKDWADELARADIDVSETSDWKPGRPPPHRAADELLLAVYGMESVRGRLTRVLAGTVDADDLVYAA